MVSFFNTLNDIIISMKREKTKKVKIGNLYIGGGERVLIQSMSTFLPSDTLNCINQIQALKNAGCDIVRVAVKTKEDAIAIKKLKEACNIPIVADIHFDYELGIYSILNGADKIRYNPGNIGSDENLRKLLDIAIEYNIPIRIGVNSGSIEKDLRDDDKLSNVDKCLLSLKKYVDKTVEYGLTNIVLSIKLTNTLDMIEANLKASEMFDYPLHIGLTESGTGDNALIKSSVAIGTLLYNGIGDTIRVSLTGDPVNEVYAAKTILKQFNLYNCPNLISCPTCGRTEVNLKEYADEVDDFLKTVNKNINVAVMGCLVNGPGEAMDADLGVAFIKTQGVLFKKKEILFKGTPKETIQKLKETILEY